MVYPSRFWEEETEVWRTRPQAPQFRGFFAILTLPWPVASLALPLRGGWGVGWRVWATELRGESKQFLRIIQVIQAAFGSLSRDPHSSSPRKVPSPTLSDI